MTRQLKDDTFEGLKEHEKNGGNKKKQQEIQKWRYISGEGQQ